MNSQPIFDPLIKQLQLDQLGGAVGNFSTSDVAQISGARPIWNPEHKKPVSLSSERALLLLGYLSRNPLCRLDEVAQACHADVSDIVALMNSLSNDSNTSGLIPRLVNNSYHKNTIQEIVRYGAVANFINSEYNYPFTIGLYPAVSCMLSCKFCGRHRGSQYDRADVAPGNELLRQVLADAPTDRKRRFYISGGLEPLTNPGLGSLVAFGASLGHRMQLYTNGMMLTPQTLGRQAGLWDLDTIRISLYGADDATAERTTGRAGVATRVFANALDFVRLREKRGYGPKLGFNFVIQKGEVGHLRHICRSIADVAAASGSENAVAFLTLREDYAASSNAAIVGADRDYLREEILAAERFFRDQGMDGFKLDLGYAMQGLLDASDVAPVKRLRYNEILANGYPQISVVIDLLGDVYLYREAAFIGRHGADRYIAGRLGRDGSLQDILRAFSANKDHRITPVPGDESFLDAFDHAVSSYLLQLHDDISFGSRLSNYPFLDSIIQQEAACA